MAQTRAGPGANFWKAQNIVRARKAIFTSSESKNGGVYTSETSFHIIQLVVQVSLMECHPYSSRAAELVDLDSGQDSRCFCQKAAQHRQPELHGSS